MRARWVALAAVGGVGASLAYAALRSCEGGAVVPATAWLSLAAGAATGGTVLVRLGRPAENAGSLAVAAFAALVAGFMATTFAFVGSVVVSAVRCAF